MKRWLAAVLAVWMLLFITACGKELPESVPAVQSTEAGKSDGTEPETEASPAAALSVHITPTPAETLRDTMTAYTDPNGCFTAEIPQGWTVSTTGYDMYYWIRIYDPAQPDLQVFSLIKAECLLKDQASKDFYESMRSYSLYTMFADMIVVEQVEDFYTQFMDFCGFMATYEPTYAGFEYPQISNFEVLEKNPYNSYIAEAALDDSVLRGVYDDLYTGQKCEGMFTGSLVRTLEMNGVGCNSMYNVNAITAPYGELSEYEELLCQIFASIRYTDSFTETVLQDNAIKAAASSELNQTLQETSDIITQGWENRQKSYDIISEKQSDATLGYERVYDVETNEVYRAYNGFSDQPEVDTQYKPITDDMYSLPIAGYIEK